MHTDSRTTDFGVITSNNSKLSQSKTVITPPLTQLKYFSVEAMEGNYTSVKKIYS